MCDIREDSLQHQTELEDCCCIFLPIRMFHLAVITEGSDHKCNFSRLDSVIGGCPVVFADILIVGAKGVPVKIQHKLDAGIFF